jgi:hypothetical protein
VVQLVHILVKGILYARKSERSHTNYVRATPSVKHWPVLCGPPSTPSNVSPRHSTTRFRHTLFAQQDCTQPQQRAQRALHQPDLPQPQLLLPQPRSRNGQRRPGPSSRPAYNVLAVGKDSISPSQPVPHSSGVYTWFDTHCAGAWTLRSGSYIVQTNCILSLTMLITYYILTEHSQPLLSTERRQKTLLGLHTQLPK